MKFKGESRVAFGAAVVMSMLAAWAAHADTREEVLGEMDGAYLDAPYENLSHPVTRQMESLLEPEAMRFDTQLAKSDFARMMKFITPIRSQGSRGTCSIFSSTAMLEATLVLQGKARPDLDLSEEWLEYLVTRGRTDDGSSSPANYALFRQYGSVEEQLLPYIGETWENASTGLAKERCGTLTGLVQKGCLLAHRDPRLLLATDAQLGTRSSAAYDPTFVRARTRATEFRQAFLANLTPAFAVSSETEAKALLARGIPVALDIDFYYGAWNHRGGEALGLKRDMDQWAKGVVNYPEAGSLDLVKSQTKRAGHSVLLVGYDESVVVTSKLQMANGTVKTFTRKGVYYFKNSWGGGSFGANFKADGLNAPGFGMITQDYAHDYGQFFKLPYR